MYNRRTGRKFADWFMEGQAGNLASWLIEVLAGNLPVGVYN